MCTLYYLLYSVCGLFYITSHGPDGIYFCDRISHNKVMSLCEMYYYIKVMLLHLSTVIFTSFINTMSVYLFSLSRMAQRVIISKDAVQVTA